MTAVSLVPDWLKYPLLPPLPLLRKCALFCSKFAGTSDDPGMITTVPACGGPGCGRGDGAAAGDMGFGCVDGVAGGSDCVAGKFCMGSHPILLSEQHHSL